MVDFMNSAVRSALMSRIRAKDTKPEVIVRKQLWARGFRFRLHTRRLAGTPDLVLHKWNALVFVHGCFWQRHEGCTFFRLPKTRTNFWDAKLSANHQRDLAAVEALLGTGWRVAVVWECAIRLNPIEMGSQLAEWLASEGRGTEIRAHEGAVVAGELHNGVS